MAAADPVKPGDMSAKKRSSLRVSRFLYTRAANSNSFVQGGLTCSCARIYLPEFYSNVYLITDNVEIVATLSKEEQQPC